MKTFEIKNEIMQLFEKVVDESVTDIVKAMFIKEGANPLNDNSEYCSAAAMTIPQSKLKKLSDKFNSLEGKTKEEAFILLDEFISMIKSEKIIDLTSSVGAGYGALTREQDKDRVKSLKDVAVGIGAALRAMLFAKEHGANTFSKVYIGNPKGKNLNISKFYIETALMKDYNSSDIIFQSGDKHFGISIKKQEKMNAKPPTVSNNKLDGFIISKIGKKINIKMNEIFKEEFDVTWGSFFDSFKSDLKKIGVVVDADPMNTHKNLIAAKRSAKRNKDGKTLELYKKIESESNEWQKKNPSMLVKIARIINENKVYYIESLIEALFRTQLKNLEKEKFYFSIIQGVGNFVVDKNDVVTKAISDSKIITFQDIQDIVGDMNDISNYDLSFDQKTFLEGSLYGDSDVVLNAAKIKFKLVSKNLKKPICDIEFRWKGFDTKNKLPVLQAFFTSDFEEAIEDIKK